MMFLSFVLAFFQLVLSEDTIGIYNGADADIADHPWMVAVLTNDNSFKCGGSLISPNWVLTAAECAEVPLKEVLAGSSKLNDPQAVVVHIAEIFVHPNFTYRQNIFPINDFLLLRLAVPLNGTNIASVRLPDTSSKVPEGSYSNITGWGFTNIFAPPSNVLQQATVRIPPSEQCQDIYDQQGISIDANLEFCTGLGAGVEGVGICTGDAGGPVIVDGVVVGVISWGLHICYPEDLPGVSGNVASARNWIKTVTGV